MFNFIKSIGIFFFLACKTQAGVEELKNLSAEEFYSQEVLINPNLNTAYQKLVEDIHLKFFFQEKPKQPPQVFTTLPVSTRKVAKGTERRIMIESLMTDALMTSPVINDYNSTITDPFNRLYRQQFTNERQKRHQAIAMLFMRGFQAVRFEIEAIMPRLINPETATIEGILPHIKTNEIVNNWVYGTKAKTKSGCYDKKSLINTIYKQASSLIDPFTRDLDDYIRNKNGLFRLWLERKLADERDKRFLDDYKKVQLPKKNIRSWQELKTELSKPKTRVHHELISELITTDYSHLPFQNTYKTGKESRQLVRDIERYTNFDNESIQEIFQDDQTLKGRITNQGIQLTDYPKIKAYLFKSIRFRIWQLYKDQGVEYRQDDHIESPFDIPSSKIERLNMKRILYHALKKIRERQINPQNGPYKQSLENLLSSFGGCESGQLDALKKSAAQLGLTTEDDSSSGKLTKSVTNLVAEFFDSHTHLAIPQYTKAINPSSDIRNVHNVQQIYSLFREISPHLPLIGGIPTLGHEESIPIFSTTTQNRMIAFFWNFVYNFYRKILTPVTLIQHVAEKRQGEKHYWVEKIAFECQKLQQGRMRNSIWINALAKQYTIRLETQKRQNLIPTSVFTETCNPYTYPLFYQLDEMSLVKRVRLRAVEKLLIAKDWIIVDNKTTVRYKTNNPWVAKKQGFNKIVPIDYTDSLKKKYAVKVVNDLIHEERVPALEDYPFLPIKNYETTRNHMMNFMNNPRNNLNFGGLNFIGGGEMVVRINNIDYHVNNPYVIQDGDLRKYYGQLQINANIHGISQWYDYRALDNYIQIKLNQKWFTLLPD